MFVQARAWPTPPAAASDCSTSRAAPCAASGSVRQRRMSQRQQLVPALDTARCTCSRGSLAAATAATQRERDAAPSGGEAKDVEHDQQRGGIFQNLATYLLQGAASRLDRGPTTCLKCRGTGTVVCPACKGHGVVEQSKVRMKTTGRVSNRCGKCGGSGRCACATCKGRGFRGDVFEE